MSIETSRLSVSISKKKHSKIKKVASNMGISMTALVELSLDEFLHRKPNDITEAAIKQSISGNGLKKFHNIDDLFKDLEN